MRLAHNILMAGRRLLSEYYEGSIGHWFFSDVADYCHSCEWCQRSTQHKVARAPLVSLPIVDEPFSKIAIDIVEPLPRSHSWNKYVLVVCDYATSFPGSIFHSSQLMQKMLLRSW